MALTFVVWYIVLRMGFVLTMAGLGGLLYGIDFGTIAAAMPYIRALGLFSDGELSVIVGAVLFGGIVSSLTAGMLAERFGRKRMIVASAALFMNQFVAWGLASTFLPWVNRWGWYSMFFFFAVNGVLYFITACFIPETKGKSLEELERLFEKADAR